MPEPERLTLAEIETRYPNEWVLLEETELDADEEIAHGLVVAHSPRRDDIHRVDRERRPRDAAYHFTGAIDEWMMLNCLHLPVVAHTLPESLGIDGLLGLDFADTEMTINFCDASITVA